ncbi:hypothetical protein VTI74DRAFT_5320 [Chaetomium olivicolor]
MRTSGVTLRHSDLPFAAWPTIPRLRGGEGLHSPHRAFIAAVSAPADASRLVNYSCKPGGGQREARLGSVSISTRYRQCQHRSACPHCLKNGIVRGRMVPTTNPDGKLHASHDLQWRFFWPARCTALAPLLSLFSSPRMQTRRQNQPGRTANARLCALLAAGPAE